MRQWLAGAVTLAAAKRPSESTRRGHVLVGLESTRPDTYGGIMQST